MSSFRDSWRQAGELEDDFDPVDGATYTVRIIDGSAFASRDGREFVKLRLEIIDGDNKGRQFEDFRGLKGDGLRIARTNLILYGLDPQLDPEDVEDLNAGVVNLIGNTAQVTAKHNKGFLNVSVQSGRTKESDLSPGQESFDTNGYGSKQPATVEDEEEIPF